MLRIKAISYDLCKSLELMKFRQIHSSYHITLPCSVHLMLKSFCHCLVLLVCQMYTDYCSFFIKAYADLDSQDFLSFL